MSSVSSTWLAGLALGVLMLAAWLVAKFTLKSGPALRAATLAILGAACGVGAAILSLALAFGFGILPLYNWPAWASLLCLVLGALLGAAAAASLYLGWRRIQAPQPAANAADANGPAHLRP
jgi:hypothetical protein